MNAEPAILIDPNVQSALYEIYDELKDAQPQETLQEIKKDWKGINRHRFIVKYFTHMDKKMYNILFATATEIALCVPVPENEELHFDLIYEILGEFYEAECLLLNI